jgi:hypothetical protein
MTLHLTKVAFGVTSLAMLESVVERRAIDGLVRMTTRYIPKRHAEIVGQGSLFWIIKHQLVARAPILRFEATPDGRHDIILQARVTPVRPIPKRAHQGWRYMEAIDAPVDLLEGDLAGDAMPLDLIGRLADLSLI